MNRSSDPPPSDYESSGVVLDPGAQAEREKGQKLEHQEARERAQHRTNWILASVAILSLLVTIFQGYETQQALNATQESLKYAKQQTQAQIDAVKVARESNASSNKSLEKTLIQMQAQSQAAERQARAGSDQAAIMQRQYQQSERPWVSVSARVGGPLTYNVNGARVIVIFHLKNIGHSPALYTFPVSEIYLWQQGEVDPYRKQKQVCDTAPRDEIRRDLGTTLFPGEDFEQPFATIIPLDRLHEGLAGKSGLLNIFVVGCVAYQFDFAKGVHETSFSYELLGLDKRLISRQTGDMPVQQLLLRRSSWGVFLAN